MTQYTILTVDDSRKELRDNIHTAMASAGIEEFAGGPFVDGRIPGQVDKYLEAIDARVSGQRLHNGEIGIWLSVINTFYSFLIQNTDKSLIVFEDDAVVNPVFNKIFPVVKEELPKDWDFFAWAIPDNQKADYYYNRAFTTAGDWLIINHIRHNYEKSPHYIEGKNVVCKTYQGYQAVGIMYSRRGMTKVIEWVREHGIDGPMDLMLFREAFKGNFKGYTLLPDVVPVVTFQELGTIARNSGMYA